MTNFRRGFSGRKVMWMWEILVDGEVRLYEAHHIAQKVHDSIERELGNVKHCMVHVNPCEDQGLL